MIKTIPMFLLIAAVVLSACGSEHATAVLVPAATMPAPSPTPVPTRTRVSDPAAVLTPDEGWPTLNDLDEGWNMLFPGGDTVCSNGHEYAFFVRPGDPKQLLIYFQGGGACWYGEICDVTERPTYDPLVDVSDSPALNPAGIFDLENPDNPFADYSMVFVAYCTADAHLGNIVASYEVLDTDGTSARNVTIQHNGYVNATAALAWAFENYQALETVFVAGGSAGSIASPFYTAFVAEQYPEAQIAQLGDASGSYRADVLYDHVLVNWGVMDILPDFPEYEDVMAGDLSPETFYVVAGGRYPDIALAQFNTAGDEVQLFFLSLLGVTDTLLLELLTANLADIGSAVDNFVSFTAGGIGHTVLGTPEFYTYQVGGTRFRDWAAALAAGEEIEDVMCTDCDSAD